MLNHALFDNAAPAGHPVVEVLGPEPGKAAGKAAGKGPGPLRFVPLRRTLLRGVVTGPLATLTVEQEFGFGGALSPALPAELATAVIEARYRFPLPGDAAVQGVEVRFGEVEIVAVLQGRAEAEAAYAAARAEGRQAALATREAPDVFTLQLSGLRANEPITVITHFVQLAQHDATGLLLRMPLTTAPRFVREDERDAPAGNAAPFAIWRDPGHRAALDLQVDGATTVSSPTHALAIEPAGEGDAVRVQLAGGEVVPDRDLLLHFAAAAPDAPALRVWSRREGDGDSAELYVLAQVTAPQHAQQVAAREVTLLVDHSGSMLGPKWEAADWAVEQFLRDLGPQDRFALAIFHNTTRWLHAAPRAADAATVEAAVRWFKAQHDNGGTELGVALEQALQLERGAAEEVDRARHLLVITDAEVSDAGRILRLADEEARQSPTQRRRISVLCIDAAPNAWLATELAERGGGSAHFLTSSPEAADISTALDAILAEFGAPALVGAALEFNRPQAQGSTAAAQPSPGGAMLDLGDLPAGRTRWLTARLPAAGAPLQVRLIAPAGPPAKASAEDTAGAGDAQLAPAIKPLFGARRINALEGLLGAGLDADGLAAALRRLGYDPVQGPAGADKPPAVYAENRRSQIAALLQPLLRDESLRYGLASSAVGFVATRREAGKQVTQQVAVANALPAGWSDRFLTGAGVPAMHAPAPMAGTFLMSAAPPNPLARASFGVGRAARGNRPMAGMLSANFEQAPDAGGSARLFGGAPAAGTTVLYDSTAAGAPALPAATTFTALLLECAAAPTPGAELLLYVGDLAQPRARVQLSDLARSGRRPLNILRRAGDVVRLVLQSPGALPALTLQLAW